jgi:acetyltransferase
MTSNDCVLRLVSPGSIAVVGASPRGNRGSGVLDNLRQIGFQGEVWSINPNHDTVRGYPCFASVSQLPRVPDCIVVSVNADAACEVLEQSFERGIPAAVVLASGFGEGGSGASRVRRLRDLSGRGMAICGPNCYGVVSFVRKSAAYSGPIPEPARSGRIALLSQSGGMANGVLCSLMTDRLVGFSHVIACGNQVGLTLEGYLDYLVDDNDTDVIGVIAEEFKEPKSLLEVSARARAAGKSIVVLKVGRSSAGNRLIQSHTGALSNHDGRLSALFRRCGMIQAADYEEFVEILPLLEAGVRLSGEDRSIFVLAGSGGGAALLGDHIERAGEDGIQLAAISGVGTSRVKSALPDFGSVSNPLDGTGAMFEDRSVLPRLLELLLAETPNRTLLATIGARNDNFSEVMGFVAECYAEAAKSAPGRLVAVQPLQHGGLDAHIVGALRAAGVPLLLGYRSCIAAMVAVARRPMQAGDVELDGLSPTDRGAGFRALTEAPAPPRFADIASCLSAAGIGMTPSRSVRTVSEACHAFTDLSSEFGGAVAVKLDEPAIMHKSDVGGVQLGCSDEHMVAEAFERITTKARSLGIASPVLVLQPMIERGVEMFVGIINDDRLGQFVTVGLGGVWIEVLGDVSTEMCPVSTRTATEMISRLRGYPILQGARGQPRMDVEGLARLVSALSILAVGMRPAVRALELNPVIVGAVGEGVFAVDAVLEFGEASDRGETMEDSAR